MKDADSNRLDYLVYSPESSDMSRDERRLMNESIVSMYSPPYSRKTSPNGLSPLDNLSIAQLSALAPVSMNCLN